MLLDTQVNGCASIALENECHSGKRDTSLREFLLLFGYRRIVNAAIVRFDRPGAQIVVEDSGDANAEKTVVATIPQRNR